MRKTFEELNDLCKKFGTDRLWSWSRVNCTHNSLYEYYLKYIAREKEDRADSIYTVTGGISHDIIEKFYSSEITKAQMLEEFEDGWITAFDISELKFNRSDSEKNNDIADKYYKNLIHFFKNHTVLPQKVALEQFVTIKIGDEYYQGYIDALTTDENGNYVIIDWKTSSLYRGEKALNECGQLVMYSMALHQKGIPYEKIRICWNFLKYCNVYIKQDDKYTISWTTVKDEDKSKDVTVDKLFSTYKASMKAWAKQLGYSKDDIDILLENIEINLAEGGYCDFSDYVPKDIREASKLVISKIDTDNKPRQIERCKIGESLQANVKSQMKKLCYSEDDIFTYLDQLIQTNDISCLPQDVQDKYKLSDCYVYVDLTEELLKHWENYIIETTKMIRDKESEYAKTQDESIWMESQEDVAKNSFYFANLCAYSANKHKPYKIYLDNLEKEKNGNIFGNKPKSTTEEEEDMSWLADLI